MILSPEFLEKVKHLQKVAEDTYLYVFPSQYQFLRKLNGYIVYDSKYRNYLVIDVEAFHRNVNAQLLKDVCEGILSNKLIRLKTYNCVLPLLNSDDKQSFELGISMLSNNCYIDVGESYLIKKKNLVFNDYIVKNVYVKNNNKE